MPLGHTPGGIHPLPLLKIKDPRKVPHRPLPSPTELAELAVMAAAVVRNARVVPPPTTNRDRLTFCCRE